MFWIRWSKRACPTCSGGAGVWLLLALGFAFVVGMGWVIGVASAKTGDGASDGVWPALLAVFVALGSSGGFFAKRCCRPRSGARKTNPPTAPKRVEAPVSPDGRRIEGDKW